MMRWSVSAPSLVGVVWLTGCVPLDGLPPLPGFGGFGPGGGATTTESKTASRQQREESSWAADDGDDEPAPPPEPERQEKRRKRGATVAQQEVGDIGATCNRNSDCEAKACFTYGNGLGYCTKMCNSWSDCPSHWECRRAHNAPQQICMQGS